MSSANKSVPQSAMPSAAFVTALSIFLTLLEWEEFMHGVLKEGANVTMKSRDEHRGVYLQNLILYDMSADQFWKYRQYRMAESLEEAVVYIQKHVSSPKAQRRYIESHFYYDMISHGPLASPRWFDLFLLFRSTPEWTHQVKELVKAVKELSPQECNWLFSVVKLQQWAGFQEKDKMPKSFLSHPVFYKYIKKYVVDIRSGQEFFKHQISFGQVKDTETFLAAEFKKLFL